MSDEPTDNYTYTCDVGECDGLTVAIIDTGENYAGWISMCHDHAAQHYWRLWRKQPVRKQRATTTSFGNPNPERHLPPGLQSCPWVCPQHHRHCNHLGTPPHAHACIFCDTTEQGAIEREAYLTNVGITAVPGMKEAIKAAANEEQKQAREAASKRCICPDQPDRFDGQHMINCPRNTTQTARSTSLNLRAHKTAEAAKTPGTPEHAAQQHRTEQEATVVSIEHLSIDLDDLDEDELPPRQPPAKNYASAPPGHRLAGASLRGRIRRFFPRAWNDAHFAVFAALSWVLLILYEGWDRFNEFLDHLRARREQL